MVRLDRLPEVRKVLGIIIYLGLHGEVVAGMFSLFKLGSNSSTPDIPSLVSEIQKTIPNALPQNKIDVHHHMIPELYIQPYNDAGGKNLWPLPKWSPEASLAVMKALGVTTTVLSLSAPGASLNGTSAEATRKLARRVNEYAANLRDDHPGRFGFFATIPTLFDEEGVLAEIAYAVDTLHADGVTLFTHYDDDKGTAIYLGDSRFSPMWEALNARNTVAFIHPAFSTDAPEYLPLTIETSLEFTHDTTRTAVHMILNDVKRNYPNVKVILSHAGGTLPYIIPRIAHVAPNRPDKSLPNKTKEEIFEDYRSFYFDTGNSGTATTTQLLLSDVGNDKILFGSDYPYGATKSMAEFTAALEEVTMTETDRKKIYYENAMRLFPRLANTYG